MNSPIRFMAVLALAAGLTACSAQDDSHPLSDAMESASTSEGEVTISTPAAETQTETQAETQAAPPATETVVVTETVADQAQGGPCDPAVFSETLDLNVGIGYCDSTVATVGVPQTDHIIHAYWDGSQWQRIEQDSESFTGFPCYDAGKLADYGFPAERIEKMITCD